MQKLWNLSLTTMACIIKKWKENCFSVCWWIVEAFVNNKGLVSLVVNVILWMTSLLLTKLVLLVCCRYSVAGDDRDRKRRNSAPDENHSDTESTNASALDSSSLLPRPRSSNSLQDLLDGNTSPSIEKLMETASGGLVSWHLTGLIWIWAVWDSQSTFYDENCVIMFAS